jgi:hypothetical protein
MISFIDDHRAAYGVEPICRVLPIAPSTYYDHVAKRSDPGQQSARRLTLRGTRFVADFTLNAWIASWMFVGKWGFGKRVCYHPPMADDQIIDAEMARSLHADACRAHPMVGWIIMRDLPDYPGKFVARLITDLPPLTSSSRTLWPRSTRRCRPT